MLIKNPISDPNLLDSVYTDPYYGLGNAASYDRWTVLKISSVNTTEINKKIAFQSELRIYFQLNYAQVTELSNNWNNLYNIKKEAIYALLPTTSDY